MQNDNNEAIQFSQPTGPWPPDRRAVLWDELARLHAQLDIDPPTATYGVEELEEEVALARRAAHQPAVKGQADVNSMPFDTLPEGGHRRSHKTWRNFYAAVFFGDQPTPAPYQSTPSEDES